MVRWVMQSTSSQPVRRRRVRAAAADTPAPGFETEHADAASANGELRPVHDPRLTARDEAVFLLQTAAEIEHALLVQYLYAAYSLVDQPDASVEQRAAQTRWRATLMTIAREEMGHLATVQNLLRFIGGTLTVEREDYPFRSDFYPFHFRLEPISKTSLAKYVVAEMPAIDHPDAELQEILQRADAADVGHPNRVGALYSQLIDLVATLEEDDVSVPGTAFTLDPAVWTRGHENLVLRRPTTIAEAVEALRAVAEQGEGDTGVDDPDSHFARFLAIYREFPEDGWQPAADVPTDPRTSAEPDADPHVESNRITAVRTRRWAQVFNLRYRMLLADLAHALALPSSSEDHALLAGWAFGEMHRISAVADVLTTLPRRDDGGTAAAAPPFELPYTLDVPDLDIDRWRLHRDVVTAALSLQEALAAGPSTPDEQAVLAGLIGNDRRNLAVAEAHLDGPGATNLVELRILPPLAIGRFGSSPEVMDNYDLVVDDPVGFRRLVPAPTLVIDAGSGAVTAERTPPAVRFRDEAGKVRPVAPFLEVWARFGAGDLEPLTLDRLTAMGLTPADLTWRVVAANLKAARRTGDPKDGVHADTGPFSDHQQHDLLGTAANFKAGKTIPFGSVRYIRPTADFPEVRFRFVPGAGSVYGPTAGDPLTCDDVYDSTAGRWDDHWDGDPSAPLFTFPAQTYEGKLDPQTNRYISVGYFDDTCDGIVSVEATVDGQTHRATARICSGVPDFAPDGLPVRTLADDLEQAIHGPVTAEPVDPAAVADSLRRAMETVRMMNTMAMNADQNIGGVSTNATNQARHETAEFDRAFEPVFGQGNAPYHPVVELHAALVKGWHDSQVLPIPGNLIRSYDEAGDLSDMARHKMPALMRGSDRLELTLTRRQIDLLRRAAASSQAGTEPERRMIQLIEFFRSMAPLHRHIMTGTGPLSDRFRTPLSLLEYLRTASAEGPLSGAESGRPLVVPADPDASAFVRLLRRTDHPMHGPFSQQIPDTGRTGLQIVEEWIAAMATDEPVPPVGPPVAAIRERIARLHSLTRLHSPTRNEGPDPS